MSLLYYAYDTNSIVLGPVQYYCTCSILDLHYSTVDYDRYHMMYVVQVQYLPVASNLDLQVLYDIIPVYVCMYVCMSCMYIQSTVFPQQVIWIRTVLFYCPVLFEYSDYHYYWILKYLQVIGLGITVSTIFCINWIELNITYVMLWVVSRSFDVG